MCASSNTNKNIKIHIWPTTASISKAKLAILMSRVTVILE